MTITNQHDTSSILNAILKQVKTHTNQIDQALKSSDGMGKVERIMEALNRNISCLILGSSLQKHLSNSKVLKDLKKLGGAHCLRFKEMRTKSISLGDGAVVSVASPYFISTRKRHGRKKAGPNGTGCHLALEVLGFMGGRSPTLISRMAQAAILAPSFDVASTLLKEWGLSASPNTIRAVCRTLARKGMVQRGSISFSKDENIKGYSMVIGIDGGRLRERRPKRGRKPGHLKRQGFHTDWKEPKLLTMYLIDSNGSIVRDFKPIHDATMENHEGLFQLVSQYLEALDINQLKRVIFTADGAPWIWQGIEKRLDAWFVTRGFPTDKVYQVLDYTHAKQHMNDLLALLPKGRREALEGNWIKWLWEGEFDSLKEAIKTNITRGRKRKQAIKQWKSYFETNAKRMHYSTFKEQGIVCGSGCVESAIRRVINLRLKSPGMFWLKDMAETFLFLRSQFISGRWNVFIRNVTCQIIKSFS